MHEMAVTQAIVDQVTERLEGRRVDRVDLEIGRLSGVVADSVRFCFELLTADTSLAGSTLVIGEPEGRAHCGHCGKDFPLENFILLCSCGSADVNIISGDQLLIKAVRVV